MATRVWIPSVAHYGWRVFRGVDGAGEPWYWHSLGHWAWEPKSPPVLWRTIAGTFWFGTDPGKVCPIWVLWPHPPASAGESGLSLTKLGCAWPSAGCSRGCVQGLGLYLWLGEVPRATVLRWEWEASSPSAHGTPSPPLQSRLCCSWEPPSLSWGLCCGPEGSVGSPGPPLGHAFGQCAF